MAMTIQDPVFGDVTYNCGWKGAVTLPIWGGSVLVRLVVPCDEDSEVEDDQRQAFLKFKGNLNELVQKSIDAVFACYQRHVQEYRTMLGDLADKMAPLIGSREEMERLLSPTELVVQQTFGSGERVIGLLFDCSWEPNLGLAVKFVNEEVEQVGPQDIVL